MQHPSAPSDAFCAVAPVRHPDRQGLHLLLLYVVDGSVFDKLKRVQYQIHLSQSCRCVQVVMVVTLVATSLCRPHSERITLNIASVFSECVCSFCGIYVMIFLFQGHTAWPIVDSSEDHGMGMLMVLPMRMDFGEQPRAFCICP